jgi:hypothetical protein
LAVVAVGLFPPSAVADAGARAASFQAHFRLAVRRHVLPRVEAAALERALRQAARVRRLLPTERARVFSVVCDQAEQAALPLNQVRARVLRETLTINSELLPNEVAARDARAVGGVVYRRYGDSGYQFQPLGSFARVNGLVDAGKQARARLLAETLLGRAEHHGDALVWKYYFQLYGAPLRWSSGLTQAVAAQALARVGLIAPARAAFAAIAPRLLITLREGPWVRLYSFSSVVVLNAQLQAVISLRQYALLAHDRQALRLAAMLARTSQRLLPAFDTGWWSRYELGGGNAPVAYHRYVTSLLWKLAHALRGGPWAREARRFRADWREPPHVSIRQSRGPVYLRASGSHAVVRLAISLSKPATLTIRLGNSSSTAWRTAGPHLVLWRPSASTRTRVVASLSATDYAGNHSDAAAPPLNVRRDTTPPRVRAQLLGDLLFWRANDAVSSKLRGLVLYRGGKDTIRFGSLKSSGVLALIPSPRRPTWLLIADSSGNTTWCPLSKSSTRPPRQPPNLAPLPVPRNEILTWIR